MDVAKLRASSRRSSRRPIEVALAGGSLPILHQERYQDDLTIASRVSILALGSFRHRMRIQLKAMQVLDPVLEFHQPRVFGPWLDRGHRRPEPVKRIRYLALEHLVRNRWTSPSTNSNTGRPSQRTTSRLIRVFAGVPHESSSNVNW